MGEPEVATIDPTTAVLLKLLSPTGTVKVAELCQTGLHRDVLGQYFEAFRPEIKNLVGWKPLKEFSYVPYWREHSLEDEKKGRKLTKKWCELLEEANLSDEHAIQIFDGERQRPPAPDYRLYLLRDMRLLQYAGGFHADSWSAKKLNCGDPVSVMDDMDGNAIFNGFTSTMSFLTIVHSLNGALETAITHRQRTLESQRQLHAQLVQLTARIQQSR